MPSLRKGPEKKSVRFQESVATSTRTQEEERLHRLDLNDLSASRDRDSIFPVERNEQTQEETQPSDHPAPSAFEAIIQRRSLTQKSEQKLLKDAFASHDLSEQFDRELISYYDFSKTPIKTETLYTKLSEARERAELTLKNCQEFIDYLNRSAVSRSRTALIKLVELPKINDITAYWRSRLSHYDMIEAEHQFLLLSKQLPNIDAQVNDDEQVASLFEQSKAYIAEIKEKLTSLLLAYKEGQKSTSNIDRNGRWQTKIESCLNRITYWSVESLILNTYEAGFATKAAMKKASEFLDDKERDLTNKVEAETAHHYLGAIVNQREKEIMAWWQLIDEYKKSIEGNGTVAPTLFEEELLRAEEKKSLLEIEKFVAEARKTDLEAQIAIEKLGQFSADTKLDEVYNQSLQETIEKAKASEAAWIELEKQLKEQAMRFFEEDRDVLLETIGGARAFSQLRCFTVTQEEMERLVSLYRRQCLTDPSSYDKLIDVANRGIKSCEEFLIICNEEIDKLSEEPENSDDLSVWEQHYNTVFTVKTKWVRNRLNWMLNQHKHLKK